MIELRNISNPEAEQHVLSCIFIDESLLAMCILKTEHFNDPIHQRIYEGMRRIHEDKKGIDIQTVKQYTDVDFDILYSISSFAMMTANFESNCALVLENYNRRKVKRQALKVVALAEDTTVAYEHVITEALAVSQTDEQETDSEFIPGMIETVEKLFDRRESLLVSETTGYTAVDSMIGGWRAGSFYIIGARPSVGKSTFALNLIQKLESTGHRTCLFSTEMPPHEIHIRMLSMQAQVESRMIEKGEPRVSEQVAEAVSAMTSFPGMSIYNNFTSDSLSRIITKEVSKGTKIIFIDYLQNIKIEKQVGTRNDMIGGITAQLKSLALRYNIAIVCLAQLNRQFQDGEPELSHLRDSGNIEQDADVVMFLEGYDAHQQEINLFVKKNRHGELGQVILKYIKKYFTFLNR